MFSKTIVATVAIAVALHATAAFADGLKTGGIAVHQKAPRSNGMHVRFADMFHKVEAPKASAGTMRLGSTNYAKYGRVAPNENARFGTTSHLKPKSEAPSLKTKQVHFDPKSNRVYAIEKSGRSKPVTGGAKVTGKAKAGMTTGEARALNAKKKAVSPKYADYKANQRKLAKTGNGGLRVKNGKVVPPKNARFGTTSHLAGNAKTAKRGAKAAKTTKTVAKGAKIAKTGKKLRTVGKFAAGGAATAVAGAALGVKVPDAVDAAMFTGKLVTDPKNAPKRLAGLATGGARMIGTAANAITDPGRMAHNLYGAANGVGRSVANTKVYKSLAKTKTGREIGKATRWTGKQVGKGYDRFKKTKTAKTIGTAARTVDKKVFKPLNRTVNKTTKTIGKIAKNPRKAAKVATKKISKGAKKVAKKLKFW
jgi:hypothetical protein